MKKGRLVGSYRTFLQYLANKTVFDDIGPICLVYFKETKKILSKRDIESNPDFPDLKSAHEYIASQHDVITIYRARKMFIDKKHKNEFMKCTLNEENYTYVEDSRTLHKIQLLTKTIFNAVEQNTKKRILVISIEMACDSSNKFHVINVPL
jgi:hypothetical protein